MGRTPAREDSIMREVQNLIALNSGDTGRMQSALSQYVASVTAQQGAEGAPAAG